MISRIARLLHAKPVRFLLVGGLATFTHLVVATIIVLTLPDLSALAVNTVAFVVAFFVSYLGHSRYTFGARGSLIRFLTTSLSGFALNTSLVWILTLADVPKLGAIIVATLAAVIVSYLLFNQWVFKKTPAE
jgi:putative flippase GtrA